jgi:hypothetical protein
MCTTDAEFVPRLVEAISRLVEDRELRRRLGHNGRSDVQNTYNLENWNRGLKHALDQAFGLAPGEPRTVQHAPYCPTRGGS